MRQSREDAARFHLLVVDDNEMNRDMLSRRLLRRGYKVDVAVDGQDALDHIARGAYDLVLLDIMMPGIDGMQVLAEVRQTRPITELPIIMVTAKDESNDVVAAIRAGANDYVSKPIDFPVLMARVSAQLERMALHKELAQKNAFIRQVFGRYLSDQVVTELLETPEGLALGGSTRPVTILMSDLRGFSAISEQVSPDKVVRMLNHYLGVMADIIARYGGTIDEFIGDAILAIFGAPVAHDDDPLRAVACAAEMQQAMGEVNRFALSEGLPKLQMGIGVHTGEVVVGNIGSATRAKYGVVGSNVNLAGRVESCTVGGQVLVTQMTAEATGGRVARRGVVEIQPKGFDHPVALIDVDTVDVQGTALLNSGIAKAPALRVPELRTPLSPLSTPRPARVAVLESKTGQSAPEAAMVTAVSDTGMRLTVRGARLARLTDVRVWIDGIAHDFYAKVLTADISGVELGLTSCHDDARAALSMLT